MATYLTYNMLAREQACWESLAWFERLVVDHDQPVFVTREFLDRVEERDPSWLTWLYLRARNKRQEDVLAVYSESLSHFPQKLKVAILNAKGRRV